MKNSTLIKGSAAIALGAALLLGGGGTLAAWNAEVTAAPGQIVSGDLNVVKTTVGAWLNSADKDVTAGLADGTYTVVPGDKLTFTQDLAVTLKGDNMAAKITAVGAAAKNGFTEGSVSVSAPVLTIDGKEVSNPLTASKDARNVKATITFEFLSAAKGDANATYNFGDVTFTLAQVVAK